MQVNSVEFSRPEIRPMLQQAAVVTPYGIGFMTPLMPAQSVVLCGSGDVVSRPEGGWSPFALSVTDKCVLHNQHVVAGELQEPVDLSLNRDDQSSSSISSWQHHASHGTRTQNNDYITTIQYSCLISSI